MPQRVSANDFEKEVLSADKTVLADFYSDSCVPCKRLSPVLSELAEKYSVQAAPTLIFFKNGREEQRLRGAVKKEDIEEIIEKLI